MGTHPIFESDFDCLTEWLKLRFIIPYYANGIICDYFDHRIRGLKKQLTKNSIEPILLKIKDQNQLRILKNGEIIFSCLQTDLDFGGDGELDKNVSDAIQKVLA